MDISKSYKGIYGKLSANSFVTKASIIASVIISIGALFFSYQTQVYVQNHQLAVDQNGQYIPLTNMEKNRVNDIRIKSALEKFSLDAFDYDYISVDSSLNNLEFTLHPKDFELFLDSWFNWVERIKTSNTVQHSYLIPETIDIRGNEEPYQISAEVFLEVRDKSTVKNYSLNFSSLMMEVTPDYPRNPQGLMLYNLSIEPLTEIK